MTRRDLLLPSLLLSLAAVVTTPAHAEEVSAGYSPARLPRNMMPTRFPGENVEAAAAQSCRLTYHGGPVISQVQVVAVYWGNVAASVTSFVPGAIPPMVASPYMDALSEYNTANVANGTGQKIVRGSYANAYPITPSITSTTIDDTQIGPELVRQINAGALPKPTYDKLGYVDTLYVTFFPPGTTITQQGANSCQQGGFCGYHFSTQYNGKSMPYAVIPYMGTGSGCDKGCGGTEPVAMGITISHEIAEAVTDEGVGENVIAWYDDTCNGEIADLCSPGGPGIGAGAAALSGIEMSYEWSNSHGTCELTNAAIGPQGGCATNADCSAPTPVCNTAKQTCVACLTNADCSGATPSCDKTTNTCRACAADADCAGATPACVTAANDPNKGKCVSCITNAHCSSVAPVCTNQTCTGCRTNADCDSRNPTCNTSTGACLAASGGSSGGSGSGGSSNGGSGSGGSVNGDDPSGGSSGGGTSSGGHHLGGNGLGGSSNAAGCAMGPGGSNDPSGFVGFMLGLAALAGVKRRVTRKA